jgi:hypothetical protein
VVGGPALGAPSTSRPSGTQKAAAAARVTATAPVSAVPLILRRASPARLKRPESNTNGACFRLRFRRLGRTTGSPSAELSRAGKSSPAARAPRFPCPPGMWFAQSLLRVNSKSGRHTNLCVNKLGPRRPRASRRWANTCPSAGGPGLQAGSRSGISTKLAQVRFQPHEY